MRMQKYRSIFKIQFLNNLAYPADLLSRSVMIVIFMWVFLHLWRVTYRSAGQTSIEGLSLRDTLWYLMLAEAIVLSKPRVSTVIANSVKEGTIAYLLNKPYNFIFYQASLSLGDTVLRFIFNLIAGGAIVWISVGPPPDPRMWPLVSIAILLAWLIDFCINGLIGLMAFITEDVSAFEWIYSKFVLILGGVLIPLDFFPSWLRKASLTLPFAYTTYGPAKLFIAPDFNGFLNLAFGQSIWLVVLAGVLAFFYSKSLARLAINGG